jgi:diacylglycerol kinase family enzyme
VSVKDGWLDVFTFSDMSKLNMISYAMRSQLGSTENTGIQHYRVKHAKIHSIPRMPVLADGILLGEGSLSIYVHPRAMAVMAGSALTGSAATTGTVHSKLVADE